MRRSKARGSSGAGSTGRREGRIFVGRRETLAQVQRALEQAVAGEARAVLLTGEPGIGKTATAQEIARQSDVRLVFTRCHAEEGAPAYWPWLQGFRLLAPMVGDAAETLRAELERANPAGQREISPQQVAADRFRRFDSVARFLERITLDEPLLLVVDDLHWADRGTLQLLRFVIRDVRAARLLVLATCRDTDVTDQPKRALLAEIEREVEVLRLGALEVDDVESYVRMSAQTEPSAALVSALHERSAGNPFFLAELFRWLADEHRLEAPHPEKSLERPLPTGIKHLIQRRVESLPETTRRTLALASVLGSGFELEVVADMAATPRAEVEGALTAALEARIVAGRDPTAAGGLGFSHSLIRDALYEVLDPRERRRLHRAAAASLDRMHPRDHRAAVAYHLLLAGGRDDLTRAIDVARGAGEEAIAHLAYEDAVAAFELARRALEAVEQTGSPDESTDETRRAAVVEGLASARWQLGEHDLAREGFLELADMARRRGDAELLSRAAIGFSPKDDLNLQADPQRLRLLEEAYQALPAEDSPIRARLLSHYSDQLYFTSERERGIELARESVAVAERLGEPSILHVALDALHYAQLGPTPLEDRLALSGRIQELARATGDAWYMMRGHFWRVLDWLEVGDVGRVDAEIGALERLAQEQRDPFFLWHAAAMRAMRAMLRGDLETAERLAGEALQAGQRAEERAALMSYFGQMAILRQAQGRGVELVDSSLQFIEQYPNFPEALISAVELLCDARRFAEARPLIDRVFANDLDDHPRSAVWISSLHRLANAVTALGDRARAARVYELMLPFDGRNVSVGHSSLGPVAHSLGLLARTLDRPEDAERHFEDALSMSERMGARLALARTCEELAALLVERGDASGIERVRSLLGRAVDTYEELGLTARLEAARAVATGVAEPEQASLAPGVNRFVCLGEFWSLSYLGQTVRVRDVKGLRYLAVLLREPWRELHVLDLVAEVEGVTPPGRSARTYAEQPMTRSDSAATAEPLLDAQTRAEYRARLTEIQSEIAEAQDLNDLGRIDHLRREEEFLGDELTRGAGLGRRSARVAGPTERARKAVYNRVRAATARIDGVHPRLASHLAGSVRTGALCVYQPREPVAWEVSPRSSENA